MMRTVHADKYLEYSELTTRQKFKQARHCGILPNDAWKLAWVLTGDEFMSLSENCLKDVSYNLASRQSAMQEAKTATAAKLVQTPLQLQLPLQPQQVLGSSRSSRRPRGSKNSSSSSKYQ